MTKIFSLLSFLLPFQLSFHFNKLTPLVYGFNIDYLTPAIYITDLVVFVIIISWLRKIKLKISKKGFLISLSVLFFMLVNIPTSDFFVSSFYKWIKVIEFGLLAFIIKKDRDLKVFDHFIKPLSYSVIVVCVLAIFQFINQGSLGGIFYLIGERVMRFSDLGITPLPYSTFPHPNSLAGFLFVYFLLLVNYKDKFNKKYFYTLSILIVTTLLLTNSLNILVAVVLMLLVFKLKISRKNIIVFVLLISLAMPFLKTSSLIDQSVVDRVKLAKASFQIFKSSPLVGVGLNNFIPNLVKISHNFENSWQLQPVHNIFLLVLSEAGILGLIFVVWFLSLPTTMFFLLPILFTGLFDHYWLTLQQNMLLMTMIIGFSFGKLPFVKAKESYRFKLFSFYDKIKTWLKK